MLINLKSPSPLLVMINSMSVPICNRFHTIRANNGKITSFRGYPSLTPSFDGNSRNQGHQVLSQKKLETVRHPHYRFRDPSLHRFDTIVECDRRTDRDA